MDARKLAVHGVLLVAALAASFSLVRAERKLAPQLTMAGAALEQPGTWSAGAWWSSASPR